MPKLSFNCARASLQGEIWKRLTGFYDRYEVSNLGRVRNLSGKVLRPCLTVRGYIQFTPKRDGVKKAKQIHQLVAAAFLGPCPPGLEVNHKNGIKTDASLSNLEYVTHQENVAHAIATGLKPRGKGGRTKLSEDDVREIRKMIGEIPMKEIAAKFGVRRAQITAIKHGRFWAWVA